MRLLDKSVLDDEYLGFLGGSGLFMEETDVVVVDPVLCLDDFDVVEQSLEGLLLSAVLERERVVLLFHPFAFQD